MGAVAFSSQIINYVQIDNKQYLKKSNILKEGEGASLQEYNPSIDIDKLEKNYNWQKSLFK